MKNKIIRFSMALATALAFAGCSQAQADKIEKTFAVEPGGNLYLDSDSGSVAIESHSQNSVEVEIHKQGDNSDKFEISFAQNGNDVKIEGDQDGMFSWGNSKIRYIIKVPKNYHVKLKTGGGSINVADLDGNVQAKTSGGSIHLGEIRGNVDVKTSGGSITVDNVVGNIDAHTSGGSVTAKISQQPTEDSKLTTSGGSVTAYLAANIAVDIDASTSGGRVRSEFEVAGRIKKTKINGTINGGGPDLKLKTSGGSVNIKRL